MPPSGGSMMDILSENRKREYPKLITELLTLESKTFVQGVSYFITKLLNLLKKK
jgi:hypothetical protein